MLSIIYWTINQQQSCITIESTRFLLISGYISGFSKAIEYFYVHHYSVMSQPSLPTKLLLTRAIIISKNDETTMIRSCTSCNVNIICVMYLVSSLIFFINSGEKRHEVVNVRAKSWNKFCYWLKKKKNKEIKDENHKEMKEKFFKNCGNYGKK